MRLGLLFKPVDSLTVVAPPDEAEAFPRAAAVAAVTRASSGAVVVAGRNDAIDAARVVAFAAVALCHAIHSQALYPLRVIGTFSVPFYIFLALYFHARSFERQPDRSVLRYVLGRARRLYVPFLAWSLIYYALNVALYFLAHGPGADGHLVTPHLGAWHLWVGGAYHLWFLPFLLGCLLVASLVAGPCAAYPWFRRGVVVAALVAGGIFMSLPRPEWLDCVDDQVYFFSVAWRSLPTAFFALAVAWGARDLQRGLSPRSLTVLRAACRAGIIVTITMVALQVHSGPSRAGRVISGLGWAAFALVGTQGPWVPRLAALGRYGFGAYLSHVLFVSAVRRAFEAGGHGPSVTGDLVAWGVGVVGGFGVAWLLNKSRATAWLLATR